MALVAISALHLAWSGSLAQHSTAQHSTALGLSTLYLDLPHVYEELVLGSTWL